MRHVFLSYSHRDTAVVERLRKALQDDGVQVWQDQDALKPGVTWGPRIQEAIREAAFFLVCLSRNASAASSYVTREVEVALAEEQRRGGGTPYIFPLRLDPSPMPEALARFQWIDLFADFEEGTVRLRNAILAGLSTDMPREHIFTLGVRYHVTEKLRFFGAMGAPIPRETLGRWMALTGEAWLGQIRVAFQESYRRLHATGRPQLDMVVEPGRSGRVTLLSIAPDKDIQAFLDSLPRAPRVTGIPYVDFILGFRGFNFRNLSGWVTRDFVHVLYFDDPEDDLLDMLFLESVQVRRALEQEHLRAHPGEARVFPMIFPTCLLSALEAGEMLNRLGQQE